MLKKLFQNQTLPKNQKESSKCQQAWWRQVHLPCSLELADQVCVEEGVTHWNEAVNPWKNLYAKVTQLLDCSWGVVSYTTHKRNQSLAFQGSDLRCIARCYNVPSWCTLPRVASYSLYRRLASQKPKVVPASFCLKKDKQSEIPWSKPICAAQEDLIRGDQPD